MLRDQLFQQRDGCTRRESQRTQFAIGECVAWALEREEENRIVESALRVARSAAQAGEEIELAAALSAVEGAHLHVGRHQGAQARAQRAPAATPGTVSDKRMQICARWQHA